MKNIPYYDFSTFPVNSNSLLELINLAVNKGFNSIIIDFGEYFPWSLDYFKRSNFTYSEKLIEKIVNICKKNGISLIPVLSILTNSDFILEGNKYKYLRNDGIESKGINILSCGVNKLVEELYDDIFSLLIYSDNLLIELPDFSTKDIKTKLPGDIVTFIKRVADNLDDSGKQLILGWHENHTKEESIFVSENINFISKYNDKKINIFNSNSYNLDMHVAKVKLNNADFLISKLHGTDDFSGGCDVGYYIMNGLIYTKDRNLIEIKQFYSLLDTIWYQIRICWEDLSYIYRSADLNYRIRFCRSVLLLNKNYEKFKSSGFIILDNLEGYYQPGVLRIWMNSKMDSVLGQLKKLEDIATPMSEGCYL